MTRAQRFVFLLLTGLVAAGTSCKQRRKTASQARGTIEQSGKISRVIYKYKDEGSKQERVYLVTCPDTRNSKGEWIFARGGSAAHFAVCNHLDESHHSPGVVKSLDFQTEYYAACSVEIPPKTTNGAVSCH